MTPKEKKALKKQIADLLSAEEEVRRIVAGSFASSISTDLGGKGSSFGELLCETSVTTGEGLADRFYPQNAVFKLGNGPT
jgi:hypothetical protein